MSFNKEIPKEEKKENDRLESMNSSEAAFPNNDPFGRNISNYNNIQNILKMYTKEIQREKNREPSAVSFQRSENILRGTEGNSDNIYINSVANISSVTPSEQEENIIIDHIQQVSDNIFKQDYGIDTNDNFNQQILERLDTLVKENAESFTNMDSENLTESRNDSQEKPQPYYIYNRPSAEKGDSNAYIMPVTKENNMNYSINRKCEKKQYQQPKKCNSITNRNISYPIGTNEKYSHGNSLDDKADFTFYNCERSFNQIPNGIPISHKMNSEYSMDPYRETRKFMNQDLILSPHSGKHTNSNYESIDIYNIDNDNDVQLDYSTVTCDSSNINAIDSNGIYKNVLNTSDPNIKKHKKTKYQSLVEFMRNKSHDSSLLLKNNNNINTKKEHTADELFELKVALSLQSRLEHDARCRQPLQIAQSDCYERNIKEKRTPNGKLKLKTYSLEDMRNGNVNIPSTIFVPMSFNVPGHNIIDSYEKNRKLEKFMQDCNNSQNLILKYPQAQKKQISKTINMPLNMASIVNNNIGVPIIYDDDFDREHYHPNVKNLHVGSIFEKHVFSILKNKKELGKKIYSENDKFKKYNYDQEHGFWISNISKDRIVNPEKNNSYITELVYEKDKSYQHEMNVLKNCKNYDEVVPSIHEFYKNNNFYKFLMKEDLCPSHLNPDIATIMRRYDVDSISCHKIISEIPGIVPYVEDLNE